MTFNTSSHRWVLITGSSAGIGEVFAKRFAREGWSVILVARSKDKLERLARELEGNHRVKTLVIAQDLTERGACERVFERVKKEGISVEGLVNNAGFGYGGRFDAVPISTWLSMIDLNIRALVELTYRFLPQMRERREGLIINVSSTASYQPMPYTSTYAASKAFVTSFTEALWLEAKKSGVRIMNLCPGVTKTEFGVKANLHDFLNDPFAEEPESVVDKTFRALHRESPTVISNLRDKFLIFLERLVPHRFILFCVLRLQKYKKYA
jgi:uncharacterized protein